MQAPLLLALAVTLTSPPCEPNTACAEFIVRNETAQGGVEAGFAAIVRVASDDAFGVRGREHDLAHEVGHVLAETSHFEGESLLLCPDDWSFGCQHGFIEEVLATSQASSEDLRAVCDRITPWRRSFRCFHGIGHGFVMWHGNDFGEALRSCDTLGVSTLTLACHQAVFHEAFNLWHAGKAPVLTYDNADPLFPCDAVDAPYRWGCYSKHAARLLAYEDFNVERAARWCLLAETEFRRPCLAEFGQYIANPLSRTVLITHTEDNTLTQAAALCDFSMPDGFASHCYTGAIAHFLSRGESSHAQAFCDAVAEERRPACHEIYDVMNAGEEATPKIPPLTLVQRLRILHLSMKISLQRLHSTPLELYTPW